MEVNRKKKLTKALKAAPNNKQIADALLVIGYRRKTPKTSVWSHQAKAYVKLAKTFTKGAGALLAKQSEKKMFMLGTRASDGQGNFVWTS
jgi:hypothetical protein